MTSLLIDTWHEFFRVLPILVAAIVVSQIVEHFLKKHEAHKKITSSEKNIARAAVIGVMTPGPLLAYLPVLRDITRYGMPPSLLASFITGQTLVGPMRVFLEVSYFGWWFFVVRGVLSVLMAISIGSAMRAMNSRVPLLKQQQEGHHADTGNECE